MSKIRILANDGIDDTGKAMLEAAGFEVVTTHYKAEELEAELKNFDAITVRSATQVRKPLIDACPNLKVIGRGGVGMDNIDVTYAREKGLGVYNTPAASSRSVAELVTAHAFTLARQLHLANRAMPVTGNTEFAKLKKQCSEGNELLGKTIGIIGFGRIGQEVARIALGLGMNVIASDPFVKEAKIVITIPGAQQSLSVDIHTTDINTLLSQSDIITIHIPKADKPVIGKEELAILKKGVILINTARGGVFDEDALIEGLNSGQIGGAGIDVFVGEPTPRADILTHPRISLTPHVGGSTVEAQENVGRELAGLIIGHFSK
ncbi:MAG: 3-phosphoglycerate dehydrogenase [Saprospiraceae bacterium]|nr:3-phosphoglycerate dehydrogenase [Candidatus Opimibacter iunctus]